MIDDVHHVQNLSESIYSLFLHIRLLYHGIHSSFEGGLIIQFPDFETKALIGENDVYIDALPITNFLCDAVISHYTLFLTMTWYQYVRIINNFRRIFTKKLYIWTTFFKTFVNNQSL